MKPATNKTYLLTLLTIIVGFNYLDRLALGLVFQDIKTDLGLTDTQLGFLGGLSFAIFYSVMGIPIARWADRGNRVTIISVTTAIWSVAVALCGLAGSFVQLILIRIGVAVGEAGCTPPAFSLIADHFSREERPRATAIYGLGGPIACLVGYFLAGWINELYGWRVTFVVLGLPGVALGLLAWFTLRDHRRVAAAPARAQARAAEPGFQEVCVTLWRNLTFRRLLFCLSVMSFFTVGMFQWQPAFMMRTFDIGSGVAGNWFAITYGIGGILGSYFGGDLACRYAAGNERLQLRVLTGTLLAAGALSLCIFLAPTYQISFAMTGMYILALMTVNGPLYATIQSLVPDRMRAMAFAIVYFFSHLIGMGLGPLAVGALSDALRPTLGDESLRYALLTMTGGFVWVAWYAWGASRTVQRDIAATQRARQIIGASEADTSADGYGSGSPSVVRPG